MNDCLDEQQTVRCGDIIVAIEGRILVDLTEDEVEANFGAEFCDGASLVVGTFEELQHFSLKSIAMRAVEMKEIKAAKAEAEGTGERCQNECSDLNEAKAKCQSVESACWKC